MATDMHGRPSLGAGCYFDTGRYSDPRRHRDEWSRGIRDRDAERRWGTILLMGDFSRFEPGPGGIELSVEAHVPPDRGGFSAVTAAFVDIISTSITWER
jgi:hypothetical protein